MQFCVFVLACFAAGVHDVSGTSTFAGAVAWTKRGEGVRPPVALGKSLEALAADMAQPGATSHRAGNARLPQQSRDAHTRFRTAAWPLWGVHAHVCDARVDRSQCSDHYPMDEICHAASLSGSHWRRGVRWVLEKLGTRNDAVRGTNHTRNNTSEGACQQTQASNPVGVNGSSVVHPGHAECVRVYFWPMDPTSVWNILTTTLAIYLAVTFLLRNARKCHHSARCQACREWICCRRRDLTLAERTKPIWRITPGEYNSWAESRTEQWKEKGERLHAHKVVQDLLAATAGTTAVDALARKQGYARRLLDDWGVQKSDENIFLAHHVASTFLQYEPVKSVSRDLCASTLADDLLKTGLLPEVEPQGFPADALNPKAMRTSMRKQADRKVGFKIRKGEDKKDETYEQATRRLEETSAAGFLNAYDPSLILAMRGAQDKVNSRLARVTAVITDVPFARGDSEKDRAKKFDAGASRIMKALDKVNVRQVPVYPWKRVAPNQQAGGTTWWASSRKIGKREITLHWKRSWNARWEKFDPKTDDSLAYPFQLIKGAIKPPSEATSLANAEEIAYLREWAAPTDRPTGDSGDAQWHKETADAEVHDYLQEVMDETVDDTKLYVTASNGKFAVKIMPQSDVGPDWGWSKRPPSTWQKTIKAAEKQLAATIHEPEPQSADPILPPLFFLLADEYAAETYEPVRFIVPGLEDQEDPSDADEPEAQSRSNYDKIETLLENNQRLMDIVAKQTASMAKMEQQIEQQRRYAQREMAAELDRIKKENADAIRTLQAAVNSMSMESQSLGMLSKWWKQVPQFTDEPHPKPEEPPAQPQANPKAEAPLPAPAPQAPPPSPADVESQSITQLPAQPNYIVKGYTSNKEMVSTGFLIKHNNKPYIVTVAHDEHIVPDHWRLNASMLGERADLGELRLSTGGPSYTHKVGIHSYTISSLPSDYHQIVMRKGNTLKVGSLDPEAAWTYYGGIHDANTALGVANVTTADVEGGLMYSGVLGKTHMEKTERGWSGSPLVQHKDVNHAEAIGVHVLGPAQTSANRIVYALPFPEDLEKVLPGNGPPPAGANAKAQPQSGVIQSRPKRGPNKPAPAAKKEATHTQTSIPPTKISQEVRRLSGPMPAAAPAPVGPLQTDSASSEQLARQLADMSTLLLQQATSLRRATSSSATSSN